MISGSKIILRNKRLADARNDYSWQADHELARLDAAPPLTTDFQHYLSDYTSELRYSTSTRCSFAVTALDGKHIGNCTYYNIDKKNAETGFSVSRI